MDIVINADVKTSPPLSTPIQGANHFYHNLLYCAGYPLAAPPVGELLRTYYDLQGRWVVVSPVHWEATHNDAMLLASGTDLKLTEIETDLLWRACSDFVESEGLALHYVDAYTWLLAVDSKPTVNTKPVQALLQQSFAPEFMELAPYWQRFITESQMFFSAHPLNRTRPHGPVNGVWLWGAGTLEDKCSLKAVYEGEALQKLAEILFFKSTQNQIGQPYTKDMVLILDNPAMVSYLERQLQHLPVQWYWNNSAYATKPRSWWKRLWRKNANQAT